MGYCVYGNKSKFSLVPGANYDDNDESLSPHM